MSKEKTTQESLREKISYGQIIDSQRDTDDLVEKKITPATIKRLMGMVDKNSKEYN